MKTFENWLAEKGDKEKEEDEFDGGCAPEDCGKEYPDPQNQVEMGTSDQFNNNDSIYMEPSIPQNAGLTPVPVYHKKVTSAENFVHNTLQQTQKKAKYAHY